MEGMTDPIPAGSAAESSVNDLATDLNQPGIYRTHFRVAYHETDGQRRVHHANYLNYFEQGRVEICGRQGCLTVSSRILV